MTIQRNVVTLCAKSAGVSVKTAFAAEYAASWFEKRIVWFDSYISDLYDSSR